jgi:hypothetical protein
LARATRARTKTARSSAARDSRSAFVNPRTERRDRTTAPSISNRGHSPRSGSAVGRDPVADAVLRVTGITTIHAGSARHTRTRLSFISQVAATPGGVPLTALNPVVSESVDIVLQCNARLKGPSAEEPTIEDILRRVGGTPSSRRSRRSGPRINRWRGTGHLPMHAARTLANAGQDVRLLSHMHERFTRSGHESKSLPTAVSGQRHGDLAILPHVDAGHGDRGDLSRRCLARASAVTPVSSWSTVVSLRVSATQQGLPPSFRHRRREMGSRTRHLVRGRPQST